jgi:peptidoglycan/LPS O-acetylase OafA/YrhL
LPALFLLGMTCGSLTRNGVIAKLANPLASAIVGVLVCAVFIAFDSSYTAGVAALLGGAFYLIASGCSFFGFLTNQPARRLGNVSYGIYLLQGLILTLVFSIDRARNLVLASPLGYWSMVLLCAVLLVAVATFAHVGIERTGIELGKRLGRAMKYRRDTSSTATFVGADK